MASFSELELYLSSGFDHHRGNELPSIQTPPKSEVLLIGDSLSSCADCFTIKMLKASIFDSPKKVRGMINTINVLPEYCGEINAKSQKLKSREIDLSFDAEKQIVSLRKNNIIINFQHNGLSNPLTLNLKASIAAITITDDKSILEDISKNGVVFGCLLSKTINTRESETWKVVPISISLPSELHLNPEPVMDDQSIHYLDVIGRSKVPHYANYLKSLKPVGILIDCRQT